MFISHIKAAHILAATNNLRATSSGWLAAVKAAAPMTTFKVGDLKLVKVTQFKFWVF